MPMSTQTGLFDSTIQDRFSRYHEEHPEVYDALRRFAVDAAHGRRKVGIRMIWERMRWYMSIERADSDEFKLNDHFTSRYARMLMEREPELDGLFEIRELRAS